MRTLSPSFKYPCTSFKRAYKAPVKKDLIRNILSKSNQRLKFYNMFSILHVLIIFITYKTIHSFSNQRKPLPTKFRKRIQCNSEDNNVSSVVFVMYFYFYCVNVASNNLRIVFCSLVKPIGAIKCINKFIDRKRDIISCVIIPWVNFYHDDANFPINIVTILVWPAQSQIWSLCPSAFV